MPTGTTNYIINYRPAWVTSSYVITQHNINIALWVPVASNFHNLLQQKSINSLALRDEEDILQV